jgi:hypothetical protein
VSAVSATAAWAVGWVGTNLEVGPYGLPRRPLIEHWDGTHWFDQTPTIATSPPGAWFNSVVALAPNDVWAVGERDVATGAGRFRKDSGLPRPAYRGLTLVEHWDGTSWRVVPSPNAVKSPYSGNQLMGVAAVAPDDVWAVGEYDRLLPHWNGNGFFWPYRVTALTEHWDGTAWTIGPAVAHLTSVSDDDPDPSFYGLMGVAASPSGDVLAVAGEVYRLVGAHWNPEYPYVGGANAITAIAHDDAWVVGDAAGVVTGVVPSHWDGQGWTPARPIPAAAASPWAISASGANDIWAVGVLGRSTLHYSC